MVEDLRRTRGGRRQLIRRLAFRAAGAVGSWRPFRALLRGLYAPTGGRIAGASGGPLVLLTTRGRRSGEPRTTPIYGIRDGDAIVVVASNSGRDRDPDWYLNLRAHPEATVRTGRELRRVRARDATSEERERLWPKLVAAYGGYAVYRERVTRQIPVVLLQPV